MEGHNLGPGVAWAATSGDTVTLLDRAVPLDPGRADLFETVIERIEEGRTARGGRLLAGLGVRYVVLLHRLAPAPFIGIDDARPVPPGLASAMRDQLDLELVEGTNSAVDMFVNTAWVPMRALYAPGFDEGIEDFTDLEARPLTTGASLFSGDGPPWTARVGDAAEILVSHTPRPGWAMSMDTEEVPRREAMSWTRAYRLETPERCSCTTRRPGGAAAASWSAWPRPSCWCSRGCAGVWSGPDEVDAGARHDRHRRPAAGGCADRSSGAPGIGSLPTVRIGPGCPDRRREHVVLPGRQRPRGDSRADGPDGQRIRFAENRHRVCPSGRFRAAGCVDGRDGHRAPRPRLLHRPTPSVARSGSE